MGIRINIEGKVGEKLNLSTNYNNNATFDFDNIIKIQYDALKFNEDEILRNIEAGNVSLPLRSELIQGSQSLLGLKTELQFGYLRITALASQQKSERKDIEIQGGSQLQEFEVRADEYDENRHFFVSHYNRAVFEESLLNMPQVNNKFRIKKIEVWITDIRNETIGIRDIVALADIGEKDSLTVDNKNLWFKNGPVNPDLKQRNELPANDANKLFEDIADNPSARKLTSSVSTLEAQYNLEAGKDFERKRARLMNPSEYFVHEELGFISLNRALDPDEVVGIAYEFDYNGKTYKVGELTDDRPLQGDSLSVLFIKMLKSSIQSTELPTWELMMKNVYSIGAYSVNDEDFRLNIFYEDPGKGQKRFSSRREICRQPIIENV